MTLEWAHLWLCSLSLQLQLASQVLAWRRWRVGRCLFVCLFPVDIWREDCAGELRTIVSEQRMNHEQSEDVHRNREERWCKGSRESQLYPGGVRIWGSELGKKNLGSQACESWNWSFAFLFRQYSWRVAWFEPKIKGSSVPWIYYSVFWGKLFNQFPHLSEGNFYSF